MGTIREKYSSEIQVTTTSFSSSIQAMRSSEAIAKFTGTLSAGAKARGLSVSAVVGSEFVDSVTHEAKQTYLVSGTIVTITYW